MFCQHHHFRHGFGSCCGGHGGMRRFLSREEKIEGLKEYAENLRKEIAEVERRIKRLQEDDDHCCCC